MSIYTLRMVRILRIVATVAGLALVIASSLLSWVHVDIDTQAFSELAGVVVDDTVDPGSDTAELIDQVEEFATAARDILPDRLLEATLDGQNAWDLLGLGFLLVGLASVAAACAAIWSIQGVGWVRWLGLLCAVFLLATTVLTPLAILATDTALDAFLPEDWKQFGPSFDLTTAPLIAIGGGVLLFLSLLGRSPRSTIDTAIPPPPHVGLTA